VRIRIGAQIYREKHYNSYAFKFSISSCYSYNIHILSGLTAFYRKNIHLIYVFQVYSVFTTC